jgi:hypothetical protein
MAISAEVSSHCDSTVVPFDVGRFDAGRPRRPTPMDIEDGTLGVVEINSRIVSNPPAHRNAGRTMFPWAYCVVGRAANAEVFGAPVAASIR